MLRRKMQARVALVLEIRVSEVRAVVAHDALHEVEVVEQDRTAQTPRYVNPVPITLANRFHFSLLWY